MIWNILLFLNVFISALASWIPGLNLWDEAFFAVVIAMSIIKSRFFAKVKRDTVYLFFALMLVVCIGLIGNLLYPNFQSEYIAVLKDIIAFVKFPVVVCLMSKDRSQTEQEYILNNAVKLSKAIILITSIVAFVGYFVDIGVYTDEIRFIKCFKFVFSHPTFFTFSYVMLVTILVADSRQKNRKFILLGCLLILLSQRTKGYLFVALILLFTFVDLERFKQFATFGRQKIKKRNIVIIAIIAALAGWMLGKDKLTYVFSYGLTAARPALYIVGVQIALDCFPVGSGFGTFASSLSGEYYSNIYSLYHITTTIGLTQESYNYMADCFWPYIYGQFGIIGFAIYVGILVKIFKGHLTKLISPDKRIAFICIWIYMIYACFGETFFTNETALQAAIVMNIFIGIDHKTDQRIMLKN